MAQAVRHGMDASGDATGDTNVADENLGFLRTALNRAAWGSL
jgi:hypothetical protein